MSDRIRGFEPVFDVNSRLLILGSFPSVKSRKVDFYYGNKQNRFWKILFGFFGEEVQESTAAKREFLLRRGIALWDVVAECEIVGSQDSTIRNYVAADIGRVLSAAPVEKFFSTAKRRSPFSAKLSRRSACRTSACRPLRPPIPAATRTFGGGRSPRCFPIKNRGAKP